MRRPRRCLMYDIVKGACTGPECRSPANACLASQHGDSRDGSVPGAGWAVESALGSGSTYASQNISGGRGRQLVTTPSLHTRQHGQGHTPHTCSCDHSTGTGKTGGTHTCTCDYITGTWETWTVHTHAHVSIPQVHGKQAV